MLKCKVSINILNVIITLSQVKYIQQISEVCNITT